MPKATWIPSAASTVRQFTALRLVDSASPSPMSRIMPIWL